MPDDPSEFYSRSIGRNYCRSGSRYIRWRRDRLGVSDRKGKRKNGRSDKESGRKNRVPLRDTGFDFDKARAMLRNYRKAR